MQPALIIINGLPATGKTTVGKALTKEFNLPFLTKDEVKEFLFDHLGIADREWSHELGAVSSDFLYQVADKFLSIGKSLIIESAFHKSFAEPRWREVINKYNPSVLEIYCSTDKDVRRARFQDRNKAGNRHKGHVDEVNYMSASEPEPLETYAPLMVGNFYEVDTTKMDDQTMKDVIEKVRQKLDLRGI